MKAILFGSIGSVVETSELQRASFNQAFEEAGLDWHWDQAFYRELLKKAGGRKRIQDYAGSRGETVDAAALHARKSEVFQQGLTRGSLPLRAGVAATIDMAKSAGLDLGFVTSTERETAQIIAQAVQDATGAAFTAVTWRKDDMPGKPDPAVYAWALTQLSIQPGNAIAIEDNRDGVLAAKGASVFTVGFPGENIQRADLQAADQIADDALDAVIGKAIEAATEAAL